MSKNRFKINNNTGATSHILNTAEIEENYSLWKSSGIQNYKFIYSYFLTHCSDPFPPAIVTVEDEKVSSVYIPSSDIFLDLEDRPTINDMFDNMLDAANKNPVSYSAVFNEELGYPHYYILALTKHECSEERTNINEFSRIVTPYPRPLTSCACYLPVSLRVINLRPDHTSSSLFFIAFGNGVDNKIAGVDPK